MRLNNCLLCLCLAISAQGESNFIARPGESVLLLDQHTVASVKNLKQEFLPATKYSQNPVLRQSEPWEGVGPYVWGTRLLQDSASKELRLYYTAYSFQGNAYRMGVASSMDGRHWSKPELNLAKFGELPARNWLPVGSHADKGVLSIAKDPRPQTPLERRFLGIRFTYDGEFISFSPDGLRWQEYASNPVWRVPSDIIHIMWDDRRGHFVAYYKIWEVRGVEIRADGTEGNVVAYMPSFDQKQTSTNSLELSGPRVYFVTNGPAKVEQCRLSLRVKKRGRDDGGGSSLSGDWTGKRAQAWAESDDGIHWRNEQLVLRADEKDPPTANIQYMFVMQYGGYYLGFLTLHDERGLFSLELAWSVDGLKWIRSRRTWLEHGAADAFDAGMVLGPTDPIFLQHEMLFPYGGFPITHDSPRQDWQAAIGLAIIRSDGFAAWRSGAAGELVTQPFVCAGDELFVNADEVKGTLQVEVLNSSGETIKGFEASACAAIPGNERGVDTLKHGEGRPITWRSAKLDSLRGQQIRLRFFVERARLFSFRVATAATRALPTPRATNW